jgi:hypothetical protein
MAQLQPLYKKLSDFIFEQPEVVVVILQQYGYDIDMQTATLSQINELVFKALYTDNNVDFAKSLDNAIVNNGYNNIAPMVIMAGVSLVTSIAGNIQAKKEAEKQRQLQTQFKLSDLALTERLAMEKIRAEQETARTNILANSLLAYRNTLQTESTARLKDTWLYVTGLGIGLGIFYGLYLFTKAD